MHGWSRFFLSSQLNARMANKTSSPFSLSPLSLLQRRLSNGPNICMHSPPQATRCLCRRRIQGPSFSPRPTRPRNHLHSVRPPSSPPISRPYQSHQRHGPHRQRKDDGLYPISSTAPTHLAPSSSTSPQVQTSDKAPAWRAAQISCSSQSPSTWANNKSS